MKTAKGIAGKPVNVFDEYGKEIDELGSIMRETVEIQGRIKK
jgi:hypothetical protein